MAGGKWVGLMALVMVAVAGPASAQITGGPGDLRYDFEPPDSLNNKGSALLVQTGVLMDDARIVDARDADTTTAGQQPAPDGTPNGNYFLGSLINTSEAKFTGETSYGLTVGDAFRLDDSGTSPADFSNPDTLLVSALIWLTENHTGTIISKGDESSTAPTAFNYRFGTYSTVEPDQVDNTGLSFGFGGANRNQVITTGRPMRPGNWYRVTAVFEDATNAVSFYIYDQTNSVLLYYEMVPFDAPVTAQANNNPLIIGGRFQISLTTPIVANFFGRIDDIAVSRSLPSNLRLPVELTAFSGRAVDGKIELSWQTASETQNAGFTVERSAGLDASWQTVGGMIAGHGTTIEANRYSATDAAPLAGASSLRYRLRQHDLDGGSHLSPVIEVTLAPVTSYRLSQNSPNPFNPTTEIRFSLPVDGQRVRLTVYDALGRAVSTLVDGPMASGNHTVAFDGVGLPAGAYVYRLSVDGGRSLSRQMLLLK